MKKRTAALLLAFCILLLLCAVPALAAEDEPASAEPVPGPARLREEAETPAEDMPEAPPAAGSVGGPEMAGGDSSGVCGEALTWTLDGGGKLTISGTGAMSNWNNSSDVPWNSSKTSITAVVIEEGVTTIGKNAFNDVRYMTRVTIPGTVVSIGENAFANCFALTAINIPSGVKSIGASAFYCCSGLVNVKLPDTLTSMGDSAFSACGALRIITLPDSLSWIPSSAFASCNMLLDVAIPAGISSIGSSAFYGCSSLSDIYYGGTEAQWDEISIGTYNDGLSGRRYHYSASQEYLAYQQKANSGLCGRSLTWTLDDGGKLTISGSGTMWDWTGDTPWYGSMSGITSIVIEAGVENIGNNAFNGARAMTRVTIPNSVASIGSYAFYDCRGLTAIDIPSGVRTIGTDAFNTCSSLVNVKLPNTLTAMGRNAFANCYELRILDLPASLTGIPASAFYACSRLMDMAIPTSITSIGANAFGGCNSLSDIYYAGTAAQWNEMSIGTDNGSLSGPRYHYSATPEYVAYQQTANSGICGRYLTWTLDGGGVLTISGSGTMWDWISSYADVPWYNSKASITSVVIEAGVENIGKNAFYEESNMTRVTIPGSVSSIGEYAFDGCGGLTEIDIPSGVTTIGARAFNYCRGLVNVKLPDTLTTMGDYAFFTCDSIRILTLPDSLTGIPGHAFESCYNLMDVAIPAGITGITPFAFAGCSMLSDVYYGGTEAQWSAMSIGTNNTYLEGARYHYSAAPEYVAYQQNKNSGICGRYLTWTLDDSGVLTVSGSGTMWDWSSASYVPWANVSAIVIESGVENIGKNAFSGKTGVTGVTIPDTVEDIGASAFYSCNNLSDVYYSGSSGEWDQISIDTNNDPLLNAVKHFNTSGFSVSVTLDRTELTLAVGAGETLTATVQPDSAADKTVTWTSSDPSVAEVAGGVVTAKKAGTATITATSAMDGNASASCLVTVTEGSSAHADLNTDSFDDRSKSAATVNFTSPAAGDFTVTAGSPCIVLCKTDGAYRRLTSAAVDGRTDSRAFTLPEGWDHSAPIIVAVVGDLTGDGKLDSTDALQVLRCSAELRTCTPEELLICDVNGDGRLTSTDALQILRCSADLRTFAW